LEISCGILIDEKAFMRLSLIIRKESCGFGFGFGDGVTVGAGFSETTSGLGASFIRRPDCPRIGFDVRKTERTQLKNKKQEKYGLLENRSPDIFD